MGLDEYWEKRDFGNTPEPSGDGGASAAGDRLSYVIQKHDASHLHYDFRLELDGVLKSWAVPKGPSLRPGLKRLAMETEDHPMEYGGFEGVIPKGQYGGGTVMLWDRGEWIPEGDPRKDYRKGRLRFRLKGEKLIGDWVLTRMKPKPGEKKTSWLLIKSRDPAAREEDEPDITEERPLSVTTGRDLEEIAADEDRVWDSKAGETTASGDGGAEGGSKPSSKAGSQSAGAGRGKKGRRSGGSGRGGLARAGRGEPVAPGDLEGASKGRLPQSPRPQLATLVGEAPEGEEWLHEIKFDGYRVLCRIEDGGVRVITRNGKDWTDRFPGVGEALGELDVESALVDGEVVVLDRQGVSSFQMLQNSLSGARAGEPLLYVFDLLHLDGYDLTGSPIEQRKRALGPLVERAASDRLRFSDHVVGQGPAFLDRACRMGVEGIISKRVGRPYSGGRSRTWLKTKCTARQEFVVVGYTEPSGSRVGLGALLLGVHDNDGDLVYSGKVGTGFDNATLQELENRLSALVRKTPPVTNPLRGAQARGVHWVRPELVAEVEFTEWTEDGRIRHPSYQGLREDKRPEEVVREADQASQETSPEAEPKREAQVIERTDDTLRVAGVRVTSPDKVLWAEQGVTKQELVEYYVAVEEAVLQRMVDRPLTLVRCPSGSESNCFYQKHANESVPEIVPRVPIDEQDGSELYMYVNGLPSLIQLVQLGVLEFHIWGSRRDRLERPDRLVFDLDPDEDLPFGRVVKAAFRLRDMLDQLGLRSWPKSTGGKGLHVVVPITRRSDWDEARAFTQAIARLLVEEDPEGYTAKMTKSRRKGRIFVDYLRNARNATAIADYSTRARPGAPVAAPLSWDELDPRAKKPLVLTIRDVPDRLAERGDPWEGFDDVRQSLTVAIRNAVQ